MFRRIQRILIKEFIHVLRDRRLRQLIFLPPLIQLIIYGYAINFDIQHIRTAIFDEDKTCLSREFIQDLTHNQYFDIIYKEYCAYELINQGDITLFIHIPKNFSKNIKTNHPVSLQTIIDGTDSNQTFVIMRYLNIIINTYTQKLANKKLHIIKTVDTKPSVVIEQRILYNENLIGNWSFIPGVIAMIIMLISLMLTALAVVREKEIGTLDQLLVSPVKYTELILGKTIPFVIIALIDASLVIIVGIFWFGVPLKGSLLLLTIGTLLFLFNSVGLGLLISSFSSTQQQAMTSAHFILTPSILLSGLIFPIANMPMIIQYFTYLNPLRHFIIIIRGIFLKGVNVSIIWPEMLGLTILGFCLFSISVIQFKRKLN